MGEGVTAAKETGRGFSLRSKKDFQRGEKFLFDKGLVWEVLVQHQ